MTDGATVRVGDCLEVMATMDAASVDAIVTDPPYGIGFMGEAWDHGVPGPSFWIAALYVAKPGAHLVAFGGTRTYHRLTCAIEDAGWEIRDSLCWLYGSGFPKSHNGSWGGTALKPAWEPIILARKPLAGTVAATVAAYGTGGLNIDGCRIEHAETFTAPQSNPQNRIGVVGTNLGFANADDHQFRAAQRASIERTASLGRWPANVVLDEDAAALLDAHAPTTGAAGAKDNTGREHGFLNNRQSVRDDCWGEPLDDRSGASRFFYTAKASRAEREAMEGGETPARIGGVWGGTEDDLSEGHKATLPKRNHHPTVKPLALMRWLVRLVTPPNGLILDPFCGSGTTGCAALAEGFRFIGIEREPEYAAIAEARLNATQLALNLGGAA